MARTLLIFYATTVAYIFTTAVRPNDDVSYGFLAHIDNARAGIFPRPNISAESFKARTKAAAMFRKVINGSIASDDPIVSKVMNLSKILSETLKDIEDDKPSQFKVDYSFYKYIETFDHDIYYPANRSVGELGYLRYNVTIKEQDDFREAFCPYSGFLIHKIKSLEESFSQGIFSEKGKVRFAEVLAQFPNQTIPIETQSALAFYVSKYGNYLSNKELIDRFIGSMKRLETYQIPFSLKLARAISEIDTWMVYESKGYLDAAYYENFCNKTELANFIASMENILYAYTVTNTVCAAIRFSNDSSRDKYLKEIDDEMNDLRTFFDKYYRKALADSFQICEPTVVKRTIEQFSNGPITAKDYRQLGDQILKDVKDFGRSELIRHVVVTPYTAITAGSKYLYKGPENRTTVVQDDVRKVTVFHTYHEATETTLLNQESFMNSSKSSIDLVVDEHYRSDDIDKIVRHLYYKDISLTAPDRFGCELWIRDFSYSGDCSVNDSISQTVGNSSDYQLLTYKWRNNINPFRACEAYHIYIFP